jgi:hypothetical protein
MIAGCVQMGPGTLTRSESERVRESVEMSSEGERFLARERGCYRGQREREWLLQGKERADNSGEAQKSSGIAKEM